MSLERLQLPSYPSLVHIKSTLLFRPSCLDKFSETGWRWLFYLLLHVISLARLFDKPWLGDTMLCWHSYPFHPVGRPGAVHAGQREKLHLQTVQSGGTTCGRWLFIGRSSSHSFSTQKERYTDPGLLGSFSSRSLDLKIIYVLVAK